MSTADSETPFEGKDESMPTSPPTSSDVVVKPQEQDEPKTNEPQPSQPVTHPSIVELLSRASGTITAEREKVATLQQTVSILKKHLHQLVQLSIEDHQYVTHCYRNAASSACRGGYGSLHPSSTMVWGYLSSNAQTLGDLLYGSALVLPKLNTDEIGLPSSPGVGVVDASREERSPPLALASGNGPASYASPHHLTRRLSGSISPGDPLSSREGSLVSPGGFPNSKANGTKGGYAKRDVHTISKGPTTRASADSSKMNKFFLPSSPSGNQVEAKNVRTTEVHREVVANQGKKILPETAEGRSQTKNFNASQLVTTVGVSSDALKEGDDSPQHHTSSPVLSLSYPSSSDITPAEAGMIARLRRAVAPPPTKYQIDEVVEAMIGEMRKELRKKLCTKTLDWPPVQKSLENASEFFYMPWTIQIEKENVCAYRFLVGPEESVNTVIEIRRKRPGCSVDSILLDNQRARQDGQRVPKLDVKHFLVHLTVDSGKLSVVKGGGHTDLLIFLERKIRLRL